MRAISVRQPYAERIANGSKTKEFRSWSIGHRGPLLICASKSPAITGLPTGAQVCIVDLVRIEGSPGRYAWILENPRRVAPTAVRGSAAIYHVADSAIVVEASGFAREANRAAKLQKAGVDLRAHEAHETSFPHSTDDEGAALHSADTALDAPCGTWWDWRKK